MYTCPICGYDGLPRAPVNFLICPSCGTEFGYTDLQLGRDILRRQWLDTGPRWYSPVVPEPVDWKGREQLRNLLPTIGITESVSVNGTNVTGDRVRLSKVSVGLFDGMAAVIDHVATRFSLSHA